MMNPIDVTFIVAFTFATGVFLGIVLCKIGSTKTK